MATLAPSTGDGVIIAEWSSGSQTHVARGCRPLMLDPGLKERRLEDC